MTSLTISLDKFMTLSENAQKEILDLFRNKQKITREEATEGELTRRQVSNLLHGLSDKSKSVLKMTVKEFESDHIDYEQLLEKLDMVGENLTGVWSGITKRCRNVTGDQEFVLIDWAKCEDNDNYIGSMHPRTFSLMAEYFK